MPIDHLFSSYKKPILSYLVDALQNFVQKIDDGLLWDQWLPDEIEIITFLRKKTLS